MKLKKATIIWKSISALIVITLIGSFLLIDLMRIEVLHASALNLPNPTSLLPVSRAYSYPVLRGLRLDSENSLKLDFVVDQGDSDNISREEAAMLIRYFLAALTLPDNDLWVNLSPYEKDRIVPDKLATTEMGRDMLSQDYVLKQLMSTLTYPENKTGKDFWKQTYEQVLQKVGTLNVPIDTFNKVWIIPDEALVYENNGFAVIKEATLKVMLEEDYLAKEINSVESLVDKEKETNVISSNVIRQVVVPEIEEDVNHGKNFARLRQVYHSLILGKWFKKKFQRSFYRHYLNQSKISGIDKSDLEQRKEIFDTYVKAFEKGCYDYIKKQYDPGTDKKIRRRYFSGGITWKGDISSSIVSETEISTALESIAKVAWLSADLSVVPESIRPNGEISTSGYIERSLEQKSHEKLEPFDGMDPALKLLPQRIESLVVAKGYSSDIAVKVAAVNEDVSRMYDKMKLTTTNYHNDVHNKGTTYGAMMLGEGAGLLGSEQNVIVMEVAAALHDFHLRMKKVQVDGKETMTPANVQETINQIKDLLSGHIAGEYEYSSDRYQDPITGKASDYKTLKWRELKKTLSDDLFALLDSVENVSVQQLLNEVFVLIRRTDFASNFLPPQSLSAENKKLVTSFRETMDKQFQTKEGLTLPSISLLIVEMEKAKSTFEESLKELGLSNAEEAAAAKWGNRQLDIEIEYARALQNVDAERRETVHQQAQILETADQLGYYYLSDWDMVQQVVEGLRTEVPVASVPGSYPFFFQDIYFLDSDKVSATAAKLASLPDVFKQNLLNNLENFAQVATEVGQAMPETVPEFVRSKHIGAKEHWNSVAPKFKEGLKIGTVATVAASALTKGGIDLQGLDVGAIEGNSPLELAPFDVNNFAGFDFEITKLDKFESSDAMLASFL